jgi:glycosyltransferase involved in cell wall biosynthesis
MRRVARVSGLASRSWRSWPFATLPAGCSRRKVSGRDHAHRAGVHFGMIKPPRVAHLTSAHSSDDSRIWVRECRTLAWAGLDVTILAPGQSNTKIEGVDVRSVPSVGGRLRRMTITVGQVFIGAVRSGATVCHIHDPELIPVALVLKLLGRKVVYDVHEDLPATILDRTWIWIYLRRVVARLAAGLEFTSRFYVDAFVAATPHIARRFPCGKTRIVQNFPLRNELAAFSDRTYSDRSPKIAYVGGMTSIRGIHELVQAIDLVDCSAVRLILVGKFEESALEYCCRNESGWRRVEYLGWRARPEVAKILGSVRAGLVTYHAAANHTAAQPTKLFEYMAAGIPVIASDFPLWRRIIERANCGLLVDPQDPRAIAEAIQWILDHSVEAEHMGRRGRAAIVREYSWEHESLQLLALYEELLR